MTKNVQHGPRPKENRFVYYRSFARKDQHGQRKNVS